MKPATASVRVQVTVEVTIGSAWGDACTIAQAQRQGTEQALNRVHILLDKSGVRVIGANACTVTITSGESR